MEISNLKEDTLVLWNMPVQTLQEYLDWITFFCNYILEK